MNDRLQAEVEMRQAPSMRVPVSKRPARLGFAVKVLGREGLRSHDARRWQQSPHLSISLDYLERIFSYLKDVEIGMYRMASSLAPYATHPDHPQFGGQLAQCADRLGELGRQARRQELRLSFHPGQFIVINSPDEDIAHRSMADLEIQAEILDRMGLGDEAVVVLHVGGVHGDRSAALDRFLLRFDQLSERARRRLVVENDDGRFGVGDVMQLHHANGIRVVFDAHHHRCYNAQGIPLVEAAQLCASTWAAWDAPPKMHFSSPRTDWGYRGGMETRIDRRSWRSHAEFIDPFAFIDFYRQISELRPDIMLEAKAKDVALFQLRKDLREMAEDLATTFGLVESGPARASTRA